MTTLAARLNNAIVDVPDFPKPGIIFKDITPIIHDAKLFSDVVDTFAASFKASGVTHVCGIESRGFIFGAPVALALGVPFVLIRKPGKLPRKTHALEYALEYGTDTLEIHEDSLPEGATVGIVDDLLATGGTAAAAAELVERCGVSSVELAFVVELAFLKGADKLGARAQTSLVTY